MDEIDENLRKLAAASRDKPDEFFQSVDWIIKSVGESRFDKNEKAILLLSLGIRLCNLSFFGKATDCFKVASRIAREVGEKETEIESLGSLAGAYHELGKYRKAIECYEKCLEVIKEYGDLQKEAKWYASISLTYDSLGEFRKAIECLEKALEINQKIGDKEIASQCYVNFYVVYDSLGDYAKANMYADKALGFALENGDRSLEAKCYVDLGNICGRLGNFEQAVQYFTKALETQNELGDRFEQAICHTGLGLTCANLGEFDESIDHFESSLEICREISDKLGEARAYANLGMVCQASRDLEKSLWYFMKAKKGFGEIGYVAFESAALLHIGKIYNDLGKPILGHYYCQNSIELSEMLAGGIVEEEQKISFSSQTSNAYQVMVPLCVNLENEEEAFEYVERSKSRAFLDLLASTEMKISIELSGDLKSLFDQEQICLARLRDIQTRYLKQTNVKLEIGEVERIRGKLKQIYTEIENFDPEYVYLRSGRAVSLVKLMGFLKKSRNRNIVLLEYYVTEDTTFIFVLSTRTNTFHVETIPLSAEKLNRYVFDNYQREVVERPKYRDIGSTWMDLSNYLIAPISKYLTANDLIYFVPYGPLHYLPLHALELHSQPLINNHAVVYSPSASLIEFCQNKGSGKLESCASFGMVFEEEAEHISRLFNTTPYNGERANLTEIRMNATQKDVLHFSCHGYFDKVEPLSSGIQLHHEILTVRDIFDIRLNTELVTLSACQTGLNQRSPGDDLIGLTRAFLYAGAPSVLVSLWSVNARSTQELMFEFYTHLKNGLDKATALQQAQIKIMGKSEYAHPYYWAPFILVGDWE